MFTYMPRPQSRLCLAHENSSLVSARDPSSSLPRWVARTLCSYLVARSQAGH